MKMSQSQPINWSDIANIIVAAVGIVALFISIRQFNIGIKREEDRDRPIISLFQVKWGYNEMASGGRQHVPQLVIKNFGNRPAYNCRYSCISFVRRDDQYELLQTISWNSVNPLVKDKEVEFGIATIDGSNSGDYYFKVTFVYDDVSTGRSYSDSLYYQWEYLSGQQAPGNFQLREVGESVATELDLVRIGM